MPKHVLTLFYISCILITFISCKKIHEGETFDYFRIRVNHYEQATASKFALNIQKKEAIGGTTWDNQHINIIDFDFEPGYIYDLEVMNIHSPNAANPYPGLKFKKTIAKTKVADHTVFEVNIKSFNINLVSGNAGKGYKLLNKIDIHCGLLCDELSSALLSNNVNITGDFTRNTDGSYQLLAIKFK